MKRLLLLIPAFALFLAAAPSARAGEVKPASQLAVTPNPATTADPVTIGNAPGNANTCEDGQVFYSVMKSDGEGAVAADTIEPDPDGNWTVTIDPIPVAGTFIVAADCVGEQTGTTLIEPEALADFSYTAVELVVTLAAVPTSSTSVPAASTRPSFTG